MTDLALDITDQQSLLAVDHDRLRAAIARVLTAERIASAEISLALVDDAEIQRVNREFLGHDYATDVISFVLNDEASPLDETVRDRSINDSDFCDDPSSLLKNVSREGEAPVELRIASDFRYTDGSAGASPSPIQKTTERPTRSAPPHLEGELIVSTETALREAAAHGWTPADELLLYVVHGLLHLCGYDDLTDEARPVMRAREREVLAGWQLVPTGLEA